MTRFNPDFKSRFRILKGGKVSLVISAMLVGSMVNAADLVSGVTTLTANTILTTTGALTTSTEQYTVDIAAGNYDIDVNINNDITNTTTGGFPSALRIANLGAGSSVTINEDATLSIAEKNSSILQIEGSAVDNFTLTNNGILESTNASTAIRINTGLTNGSTITNTSTGVLRIDSTEKGQGYGIQMNDVLDSTITNAGIIDITTEFYAYGIVSWNGLFDGSVISNTETIQTNAERTVETDTLDQWTYVHSQGIASYGLNDDSTIENSGLIKADATLDLTINASQSGNFHTTAIAKGIIIGSEWGGDPITGTDAVNLATITNSGTIDTTATLNAHFGDDDLYIYGTHYERSFAAKASGIEAGDLTFAKIENISEGTITSLAEVTVDPEGSVYYYGGTFAESNGIKVSDLDDSEIINIGSINSTAIFNGTNYSRAVANGIYIDGDVQNSLIELKNITVESTANATANNSNAKARASGFEAYSMEDSTIEITGDVSVNAFASSDDDADAYASGIYINQAVRTTIKNGLLGNIQVNAEAEAISTDEAEADAHGIYVEWFTDSTINNMGNIEVTGTAHSVADSEVEAKGISVGLIDAGDGSINSSITNSGNIFVNAKATVSNDVGINAVAYGIKAFMVTTGEVLSINNDEDGVISAFIDDELDKKGYSLKIDDYGTGNTVTVTNSGTLKGNLKVDGTLTNNGTSALQKANIELAHNAMGGDSAYIKNFTNGEFGKLTIGLFSEGIVEDETPVFTHSQLVTENAIFENGSTIGVNVLTVADAHQNMLKGQTLYDVVKATNSLTIDGKLNITDNSYLLDFEYVTTSANGEDWLGNGEDGAIHLNIVQATNDNGEEITIETATKDGGGNKNTQAAAKVLNNISNNLENYPAMASVITAFNGLQTEAQIAQAVQTTTALTPTATVGATTQIANGIAGIVTQRQNTNINGGLNSGDTMFAEKNFWFKPFGSFGSQNDKDGISGFDVKAQGFGLGLDGEYKDNQNIGFGLFYTSANVDVNNVSQEANLDVFTTLVYGNVPVIDDKTNFLYQAGYSWQKTEGERKIFTGDIATSDYTSKTASIDLKLMRDVQVSDDLLLQPMVETTYRHFTNPAYKENGAGALNLNVDKFTSSDLIVGLGTLAHYKLTDDSKIVGNVNIGYDLHGKNQTVTSSFEGAAGLKFDTDGIDNGKWNYAAGIGYEKELNKTNSFNISYDYQGQGSDFSNNTVSAKYVLKF